MQVAVAAVVYILGPVLLLFGCKKFRLLNQFGTVGLGYVLGIILGNIGLVDEKIKPLQDNLSSVTIALALPLLLFSINIRQWSRLALRTSLAMILGIISVLMIISIGHFLLKDHVQESWKVAGLMVGVYIGASANMASIMKALNVDADTFILVNAYDILICIVYFMFLITIAQRVLGKFLLPFKPAESPSKSDTPVEDFEGWDAYRGIHRMSVAVPLLLAVILSGCIVGISFMIKDLFAIEYQMAAMIITITALSILLSLVPFVNGLKKTFQSGMYLIVIFCIVIGSMADLSIFTTKSLYIGAFIAVVVFGSMVIQVLLSKLFRIDTDTTIIASTAFIFSAPFVPTVANALKNKEIILSGITIGIIGYTTGNFLGITLAYLLR